MKNAVFRNIKRMDDPSRSTHGWLARVQRDHRTAIKLFSDSVWGGQRKFSVSRWGERGAKLMAIEECEQQVRRCVAAKTPVGYIGR